MIAFTSFMSSLAVKLFTAFMLFMAFTPFTGLHQRRVLTQVRALRAGASWGVFQTRPRNSEFRCVCAVRARVSWSHPEREAIHCQVRAHHRVVLERRRHHEKTEMRSEDTAGYAMSGICDLEYPKQAVHPL